MTKKPASDKGRGRKIPTKRRASNDAQRASEAQSRRGSGKMIGALVPSVTKPAFERKSPLFIRLILDWENIVGPHIAQQSEPCRLRPGVLTIRCSGPIAMEIQYAIPRVLERINTACGLRGEQALQHIKLVQDRTVTPPSVQKRPVSVPHVCVPDVDDGSLREALERLGGQIAARTHNGRS